MGKMVQDIKVPVDVTGIMFNVETEFFAPLSDTQHQLVAMQDKIVRSNSSRQMVSVNSQPKA